MIDFYCVFDGCFLRANDDEIFSSIKELLKYYELIDKSFDLDKESIKALCLLAKNSRKRYSINKNLGHFKGLATMSKLLESGFLKLEKSKEKKRILKKGQKQKKEDRKYAVQDKVIFKNNFSRFFFYFLKPNEKMILEKRYDELVQKIKKEFTYYQSFCFEMLGKELVEKKFKLFDVSSFWNKELELDLFYKDENFTLVGEVKFTEKKLCKNIFNILKNKAKTLGLKPDYYVLFSKNGFSSKLLNEDSKNLFLFSMKDLKSLLKDIDERKYTKEFGF